jgi:hypothetical protein
VAPNIAPKIDIAKSYRRLKRLRRMVKLAESLNGEIKSNGPQSFAFDRRRR